MGFYSRAALDVATADPAKPPPLSSMAIENGAILLGVLVLGLGTLLLVHTFNFVVLYPLQTVGCHCWDVALLAFGATTLISMCTKRGPSRAEFKRMSEEDQTRAKKLRKKAAKAAAARRNAALLLCLGVAALRGQYGSLQAAATTIKQQVGL